MFTNEFLVKKYRKIRQNFGGENTYKISLKILKFNCKPHSAAHTESNNLYNVMYFVVVVFLIFYRITIFVTMPDIFIPTTFQWTPDVTKLAKNETSIQNVAAFFHFEPHLMEPGGHAATEHSDPLEHANQNYFKLCSFAPSDSTHFVTKLHILKDFHVEWHFWKSFYTYITGCILTLQIEHFKNKR